MTVHTYIENETMYPEVRRLLPDLEDDVLESYEEHHVADVLVMELAALNPDTDLYFMTGADALASILSWQNWEDLFSMARFVGVSRPGYELDGEHIAAAMKELPADALSLVEVPALAISSTDCRRRAEVGRPIWYLVPDGVVQYVSKRGLYRAQAMSTTEAGQ